MPSPGAEAPTLVVLGCRVVGDGPSGALLRRLEQARIFAEARGISTVIMSGGKMWNGRSEARAMTDWWTTFGAPTRILLEEESLDTLENARQTQRLLASLGSRAIALVTCDFHMRRAALLFRERGLSVEEVPARFERSRAERIRLALREWGALELLRYKERLR